MKIPIYLERSDSKLGWYPYNSNDFILTYINEEKIVKLINKLATKNKKIKNKVHFVISNKPLKNAQGSLLRVEPGYYILKDSDWEDDEGAYFCETGLEEVFGKVPKEIYFRFVK